jgi:hypothetical protein
MRVPLMKQAGNHPKGLEVDCKNGDPETSIKLAAQRHVVGMDALPVADGPICSNHCGVFAGLPGISSAHANESNLASRGILEHDWNVVADRIAAAASLTFQPGGRRHIRAAFQRLQTNGTDELPVFEWQRLCHLSSLW